MALLTLGQFFNEQDWQMSEVKLLFHALLPSPLTTTDHFSWLTIVKGSALDRLVPILYGKDNSVFRTDKGLCLSFPYF